MTTAVLRDRRLGDFLGSPNLQVDKSYLYKSDVTGNPNAANVVLGLSDLRVDSVFSQSGNTVTYSPSAVPNILEITAMVYSNPGLSGGLQRVSPVLELLKNGTVVAVSATGYQRHSSNHDSSSNTIAWVDHNPQSGDTYQLRSQQGSNQTDVLTIDESHFSIKATESVEVAVK